ncbi:hypothetical protein GCM10022384_07520 [Streptomyces marokkonensis]|uniref:Uncharacterized protein n=1 Tax=Streptomyces marokkonensis TaxID=324855 RepID=A0ABP7NYY0_9ACTN
MPEQTPQGEEQRTMLSFTEAAERLVADGIAQSMTAEALRKLARDPASGWPIGPDDYRVVGKTRMLPYELLVPYMQARRRGRGPDKTQQRSVPTKKAGRARKPQGVPVTTTTDPRIAILSALNDPPYNQRAEKRCVPWDEAEKLLGAYRAAVLREAANRTQAKIAGVEDGDDDAVGLRCGLFIAEDLLRGMAEESGAQDG